MNAVIARLGPGWCRLLAGLALALLAFARVDQVHLMGATQAELDALRGEHQALRLHLSRLALEKRALLNPVALRQTARDHLQLAADARVRIRSLPVVPGVPPDPELPP